MPDSYKLCPICGTAAPHKAFACENCGTSLEDVASIKPAQRATAAKTYDYRYGEDDLLEQSARSRGTTTVFTGLIALLAVACIAALGFGGLTLLDRAQPTITPLATLTPNASDLQVLPAPVEVATNTLAPSPPMATVTPLPPTATMIPTAGPCIVQVRPNDDLISLAWSCGHRSLDVIPLILSTNNLAAPERIQVGQELIIPLPTEIADPDAETEAPPAAADAAVAVLPELELPELNDDPSRDPDAEPAFVTATPLGIDPNAPPTLLPGVGWHSVIANESMASIAISYGTTAEVLSQLNPEIAFSQCDFGQPYGGPRCTVLLRVGQEVRVPVPTPMPTSTPTFTGSETPTPSATPTFNAPNLLNPQDRILFRADELITLRWVATGMLNVNEVYRVTVEDLTANRTHTADTEALTYIVPNAWQGSDGVRHEYRWFVSVVKLDDPDNPLFSTPTRLFTWESRP